MFKKILIILLFIVAFSAYQAGNDIKSREKNPVKYELPDDYVERTVLNWKDLMDGLDVAPGVKVPSGYKMCAAFDNYLQLSTSLQTKEQGLLSEKEMNQFMIDHYLPSDCKLVEKETYFKKRNRANGSDSEISSYTYLSPDINKRFTIKYIYYYDRNSKLATAYSHATIDRVK
ncbi:hypothetical protein lbkm_0880 [Lachnospiraceae bacterium KM106-2]|nr:hypothetical protein lbkm_0880 [Lachnospiraceae bacterium KM106-2]